MSSNDVFHVLLRIMFFCCSITLLCVFTCSQLVYRNIFRICTYCRICTLISIPIFYSEITQPHPSKSSTDHHNETTNSKHGDSIVTESPVEHCHFDIIVEPEESLSTVHKQKGSAHQSYYILLTCGVISGVLFLLIVITGVLILTVW